VYKGTGLVAWLGDARCVLARKGKDGADAGADVPKISDKLNAFALSKDHKAVILKEKQRIEKVSFVAKRSFSWHPFVCIPPFLRRWLTLGAQAGGFVSDGRVCGIMEVSRSIGDAALKSKGVSPSPDTTRIALTQVCYIKMFLPHDRAHFVRLRAFPPQKLTEEIPYGSNPFLMHGCSVTLSSSWHVMVCGVFLIMRKR
jgi:hypothetical protein